MECKSACSNLQNSLPRRTKLDPGSLRGLGGVGRKTADYISRTHPHHNELKTRLRGKREGRFEGEGSSELNGAVQVVNRPPKIIFRSKWKCWEIESSLTPPLSVFYRAAAHQDWNQRSHFTSNLSIARRGVNAANF